jgi:HEAT repeats
MRKAVVIALLASALIGPATADKIAEPAVDVPALVGASDLIVVGRAGEVQIAPNSASETLVVWVDRVIASAPNPASQLAVRLDLPVPGSGLGAVETGEYGMFFLRNSRENGVYTAVNPYHPALVAAPAYNRTARSSDALAGVAHELTRVLSASAADLIGLRDASAVQHLYWEAADALETIPHKITGPELRTIAASEQTPARLWAIAVSLNTGDPNEVAARAPGYLAAVKSDLLKPGPDEGLAVARLAVAIQARVYSPEAVPVLAALLASTATGVRRAAASALADIATPDVIAPLAKAALNDREQNIRYYAVRGLAQATGGKIPTLPLFYAEEAEMLAYWRNWAKANVH